MAYHPFRHLGLKFLSIALAVLLWLSLSGEQVVERSLRVPLELRNIPRRLEVVSELPSTIDVRVRGASGTLGRLSPGDLAVILDVGSARPGLRLFHVTADSVVRPFDVEVTQVTPASLSLEFEPSVTKVVPVAPRIEGDPAPGYVVGTIRADPPMATASGPESRMGKLVEAITEPVSVAGATGPVQDEVTVGLADSVLRLQGPPRARVTVDVLPAPVARTIRGVAVQLRHAAAALSASAEPAAVAVTLKGPRAVVGAATAASVEAFVDLAGLGSGHYNLPVRVEPPPQSGVVEISPASVRVTIK